MNAISEFVEVEENMIHFKLPKDFKAKKVQLIILPFEEEKEKKKNRILSLKGSIQGKYADSLENHLKTIREEW